MNRLFIKQFILASFVFLSYPMNAQDNQLPYGSEKIISNLFGDHMILQREIKIPVWGTGKAGDRVSVKFAGQTKTSVVDGKGKWRLDLNPLPASEEPREMVIIVGKTVIKFSDILVGEVWLASGQSNMAYPVSSLPDAESVLAKADDSKLRFFTVNRTTAEEPQDDLKGKWELSNREAAKGFSAVAYFFSREIRQEQKCPVAIIHASWGGTSIETWISLAGLKKDPPITKMLDLWNIAVAQHQKVLANPKCISDYESNLKQWQKEVAPAYNLALKNYNQAIAAGKPAGEKPQPSMAEPVNPDPMAVPGPSRRPSTPTVDFNGMIAPLIPYAIRGVIWHQGENNGNQGIEYRTLLPRLIDDWRNLWKQPAEKGLFPFIFVQLPCNGADVIPVAQKGWPFLREAQFMTLSVPKTGMAITIDVGDPKNVHPADKIDVGQRLALVARKVAYHENIVYTGPLYKDYKIEKEGKIRVRFRETGSGLAIGQSPWYAPGVLPFPEDKLVGFFIAGKDKKWMEADAQIDGNTVVVSSKNVPDPIAVRYGWANSPRCNLYNKEGFPASPFRTDGE